MVAAGSRVGQFALAAGTRLAGYRLDQQIGAGGMAVVYRATDERLGRVAALKVLAPALAADEQFRLRFIRESRAAAAVDDPHIIPVYEAGDAGGVLYIAMRYVAGGDLGSMLARNGPMPPSRVAMFVSAVASALDAAHAAGLVHCDVKPANMLVDHRDGRPDHVYLSDFGLSKGAMSPRGITSTGQFFGSVDYSAPEQIQGKALDGRADQYALACSAFALLTGTAPFTRELPTAIIWAHMSEPPPSVSSRQPGLPVAADAVLAKALAKAPEDRFGSCREFADALRGAFGLTAYGSSSGAMAVPPAASWNGAPPQGAAPSISGASPHTAGLSRNGDNTWPHGGRDGTTSAHAAPAAHHHLPTLGHLPTLAGENTGHHVRQTPPTRHPRRGGGRRRAAIVAAAVVVLAAVIAAATLIASSGNGFHPDTGTTKRRTSAVKAAAVAVPRHYSFLTALPLPQGTQEGLVTSMAFSPDGKTLAIGYNNGSTYLWDVPGHHMLATLTGPLLVGWPQSLLTAVAFSPDGKTLAVANSVGSTALWNVAKRQVISTLTNPAPYRVSVAFSPGGKTLLTNGGDSVYQWDVTGGRLLGTLSTAGKQAPIETVAYSPDGTTIAAGDTLGSLYLWNAASGQLTGTLAEGYTFGTGGAVFSPDGKTLAITDGAGQGDIFLFNVSGQRLSDTFTEPVPSGGNGNPALAFSPDGGTLASISSGDAYMWNMTTGHPQLVASLPSYQGGGILSVAISPDGRTVAIGQNNAAVSLWAAG